MNGRASLPVQALIFSAVSMLAIHVHLVPMQMTADSLVLPDLLLALAAAWFVRQPESMPLLLVAAIFLLADLLLDRATGLWALISLLIIEAMGLRREALRNRPFPIEWMTFASALAAGLILRAMILRLALVEPAPGAISMQLFAVTVISYPAVVLILHYVLRIRAPKPAERSRRLGRVA